MMSSLRISLDTHRDVWENARDFHGKTLLHSAAENENLPLVKTLVCAGVNINAKERCGATALTIAVIKKNEEICRFLLDNFASFDDHFFPTMPSPHLIARTLELNVANIMDEKSKEEIANNIELWETVQNTEKIEQKKADEIDVSQTDREYLYERKSSAILFVGDQGTNKVMHGVKGLSVAAYSWCAKVLRDMHAKGYLYEVCKKVMTPGALMHILWEVLSRKKIVPESFGKKNFRNRILAEWKRQSVIPLLNLNTTIEFQNSTSFPVQDELRKCKRSTGNHNAILLLKFKEWIRCNEKDAYFKYYSQMFILFGLLQQCISMP